MPTESVTDELVSNSVSMPNNSNAGSCVISNEKFVFYLATLLCQVTWSFFYLAFHSAITAAWRMVRDEYRVLRKELEFFCSLCLVSLLLFGFAAMRMDRMDGVRKQKPAVDLD